MATVDVTAGQVLRKANNALNTVVGLLWAAVGATPANVSKATIGNNAIQFQDHPYMPTGSAVTLGNVIVYALGAGPDKAYPNGPMGAHERAHTLQGEILGLLYLPLHLASQAYSYARTGTYDRANPLEIGPNSNPPRPWPWA